MARLTINGLKKAFRTSNGEAVTALDGLDLVAGDGEFVALAGPSGSGKTTTLRLIAGLERPCGGTISIDDRVINDLKPHERDIAMVFQGDTLLPHLNAFDNMALGLRLRKTPTVETQRRVEEAADLLEIGALLKRFPSEMSGGERRRVALGRAMVRRPKLFLLDEPLANLDSGLRERMRVLIARVHQQLRATTLMVTHDEGDAAGHRIVRLPKL